MSIPASAIVNVNPGVISAGGAALDLNGLILTSGTRVPIGTVQTFGTPTAVSNYFGPSSDEAAAAVVYFGGYDNSTAKPGALLFAQYPTAAVAGYLRGGNVAAALTLAQLQALSGVLTVSIDGVAKTSSTISLSAATSYSNAATIIAAGFTSLGGTVTFDSVSGAFVFTSSTTGASSTVSFATGTLAAGLLLTAATGAVTSAGAVAGVPATNMNAIAQVAQNWASFMTLFEPNTANKIAFAAWANSQDDRFMYAMWDTDVTVTTSSNTASAGYAIVQANYTGTAMIYAPSYVKAAFLMGAVASLDFTRLNGRATLAFRSQSGLTADVTTEAIATQLIANGYNFYGQYATANDQFTYFYPGSVTGDWDWIDSYVNQIWLNANLQLALLNLLVAAGSIPYNVEGYTLIEQAAADPINAALNFGAIRPGITLSASQRALINSQAGVDIGDTLQERGWYFQVQDAAAATRAARQSPPCTLWYTDGQSVQSITLASLEVQ